MAFLVVSLRNYSGQKESLVRRTREGGLMGQESMSPLDELEIAKLVNGTYQNPMHAKCLHQPRHVDPH